MTIAGCGTGSSTKATAGAISIGTNNKISSLALGSTVKLSMMPASDKLNAGVDWLVTCGGNPVTGSVTNGACGTLLPAHTADGASTLYTAPSLVPIGTTITITATVTSNPSQSSSVSLTILPLPVSVSFAIPPPSSLGINQTYPNFNALVTNDPTGAGVIWTATCASPACGSFNPTTTATQVGTVYTAPAAVPMGGVVTITATSLSDTTKSASTMVTITGPAPPVAGITISVLPSTLYAQTVGPAHLTRLTAIVSNDAAAAGADWSVSCGASKCGGITAHTASGAAATYTAPSAIPQGGTVTVTAKSTTNPAVSATATVTIVKTAPIVVTFTAAPPATLTEGSSATLTAKVASDSANLGVDWAATCGSAGACGTFNLTPAHTASAGQITYTAPATVPAGGVVTITASSPASTPANLAVAATTIVALPPSISFTQTPPTTLVSLAQTPVSATVANDVAPGGVTWTVQCGSSVPGGCGFISPYQTASGATEIYTAPPVSVTGTSVTIVATSIANTMSQATSNPIAITPSTTLAVNFIPTLPAQVQANTTVNLNAAVTNDATGAGIDWQVCSTGCGFFTVKPAVAAIPATATTPYVPPVAAVTATSVSGWSNGLPIPYTAPPQAPASGMVAVAASAHADATKATSGTIAIVTGSSGPALTGVVEAGSQPVVGAAVSLYAAGTSGYASAASQIASATADKNGAFTMPATYSCSSPNSQLYLVASGGSVGSNAANTNLALMTALGSCSGLGSAPIVINEITTIASAFATAPFTSNDALTGNSSYLYLGASSGNLAGLANAFATVNNLVDITTGQARFVTPAGNAAVPYAAINTLADILNSCTATAGGVEGDGSTCSTLFTATDVVGPTNHALYNAVAPADTLQAAFNIAQHPVTNYGYQLDPNPPVLLSLTSPGSPFQPILSAQPNDWSLSLNYTSGGGLSMASTLGSFAVDASGDLWITDTKAGSVIEWNTAGAALSPTAGFAAGGGPIAIDAAGDVWTSGDGVLNELTSLGSSGPGGPFAGVAGGGSDISIDALSNLWIASGTGVTEISNLGQALSPPGGFMSSGVTGVTAVGIDSANNVWLGNGTFTNFAELTNPGGQLIVNAPDHNAGTIVPQIAADSHGDIWAMTTADLLCEVAPYGGKGSVVIPACYSGGGSSGGGSGLNFAMASGVSFDGAGTLWLASQGGGSIQPSVLPVAPSLLSSNSPNYLASPSLSSGPLRVAVDGSGNVWVLLANNTVTEYVGVATPVVTPIALGLKNKKLGAKP